MGKYILTKFSDKFTDKTTSTIFDYSMVENPAKREVMPVSHLGFYNDLDGGLDAYPIITSTEGNYWVSFIEAWQLKELLTDEHFAKRTSVKYPEQMAKVKQMVEQMDEDDDQILILMKLKK